MEAKRCIIVTDSEDKQWIGDGKKFYAVDENVRLERETVLTILDIDKEKRNKIVVFQERSRDPRFSVYPERDDEERLTPYMAVMYSGKVFMTFMNDRREVFAVEHSALKPVDDMGRDYTLRRRTANGEEMKPVIAVATDMFISALLMPVPRKETLAIIAAMSNIVSGEVKSYGGEDEDCVTENETKK